MRDESSDRLICLGVIGGSGLYSLEGLTDIQSHEVETPFGVPSAPITEGQLGETALLFLPRHGLGHHLNPSEVPYRANIAALRQLGATHLLGVSAVGSLREDLPPRTLICPDQIIDRTVLRDRTFFERGIVAHVGLADPFSRSFSLLIQHAGADAGQDVQVGGTYICIEGPQFSTRAESNLYRSWGADIIGMTAMPEARLAREVELPYALLALVTDYDVWHQSAAAVSVELVMENMHANAGAARAILTQLARHSSELHAIGPEHALATAFVIQRDAIDPEARARVSQFAAEYLG